MFPDTEKFKEGVAILNRCAPAKLLKILVRTLTHLTQTKDVPHDFFFFSSMDKKNNANVCTQLKTKLKTLIVICYISHSRKRLLLN